MHALFTGVSSFTGCWFVEALAEEGFVVEATCRRELGAYPPLAAERLARAGKVARLIEGCAFGDARFLAAIAATDPFDLLCHHGAETHGQGATGFGVDDAVAANTHRVEEVLDALLARGCRTILVTGSVLEADEGRSTPPAGAVTAYGLAKSLSWQILRYQAERRHMTIGKLTIPHPFGPLEKPGLTTTLARRWLEGRTPLVEQPHLVRDFVHVDLLAASYGRFARFLVGASATHRLAPSGYVESVADFAERFAAAMRERLGLPCPIEHAAEPAQIEEPLVRCNCDPLVEQAPGWHRERSWDRVAEWYKVIVDRLRSTKD
jgi:nucleoside-diphosphate-sugar epimerase